MSGAASATPLPDTLLASCVNGGGIFLCAGGEARRISPIDTTGIGVLPGGFIWARQTAGPAEVRRVVGDRVEQVRLATDPMDLHDVLHHEARLYVVATQTNTVFELEASSFGEMRRWTMAGEPDSHHLNSVCVHDGRILVSRFGDFTAHRGYKERTKGAGQVIDIETGEAVITGLSQPHSLVSKDGLLWLCNSEAHSIRAYRNFELANEIQVDGYPRGLALGASCVYVGTSRSRNEATSSEGTASVVALDVDRGIVFGKLALPVDEIYDLRIVDPDTRALVLAGLDDTLAEVDRIRDERNRAALDAESLRAALAQAELVVAEADRTVPRLMERAAADSVVASDRADRMAEDRMWIDLQQEALLRQDAALQDRDHLVGDYAVEVAALNGGLQAVVQRLAATEVELAAVTGSRTWRWTAWLRGSAAESAGTTAQQLAKVDAARALAATRIDLAAARALTPVPPLPARSTLPVLGLAFAHHDEPEVSIVVATYGNFEQTLACLQSILRSGDAATYEVIVVEDCSGEPDMGRFAQVPGLRYVENPENFGYLRSINRAAPLARGEYLHLLNNDTEVTPGWLDALLSTFVIFHECGLAGSRLVYPDGRLQEAGGIVWSDGNACNHGRGDDPSLDRYAVVREVDYVSGASLMLPRQRFIELGGFDERYLPAYYEDTDLAFRIREAGGKVYVQPASLVVHHEGLSHGTDTSAGIKANQVRNRDVFLKRWRDTLEREQLLPGEHAFLARDRAQLGQVVLVVDRHPPEPDRDAGSRAIWQLMRVLYLQGFKIKFWSHETGRDPAYVSALRVHGIEVFPENREAGFDEWIAANGAYIDHVVLSRPLIAQHYLEAVRLHTEATVTYYGHDIHYQRIASQARLQGNLALLAQATNLEQVEHMLWAGSDLVLYPSTEETVVVSDFLSANNLELRARTIPLYAFEAIPWLQEADREAIETARDELLFVGGFNHAPNADGVLWFAAEVWPLVHARHPALRLCLAGSCAGSDIAALAADDSIEVTGYLSEDELRARYRRARVVIAPLRFGAGTKGKVIEAMWHGVPCVTTPVGQQGLSDATALAISEGAVRMADDIAAFVDNPEVWWQASRAGQAYVNEIFSVHAVWSVLSDLFAGKQPPLTVAVRRQRLQDTRQRLADRQWPTVDVDRHN